MTITALSDWFADVKHRASEVPELSDPENRVAGGEAIEESGLPETLISGTAAYP